jgi:outer membrane protein OmpA-like peptidoglycan-associated protein
MTSFLGLSGLRALTLSAALSMTAGLAVAGDNVSADQIIHALQPKPLTRGLSAGPQADPAVRAREIQFVDTLRNRNTRSLSLGERDQIAGIAATKPNIDLDIQFDYNSAEIRTASMASAQALGKALTDLSLKGSTFVVAGHTDAIGSDAYNQDLSERRADTIKRYLRREIRHYRHRSRHRRLRQDRAEGSERADGPDQPPRPGRQHGYQDRVAVKAANDHHGPSLARASAALRQ